MNPRYSIINSVINLQRTNVQSPQATVSPVISNGAQVGDTLICSQGTWLYNPASYAFQWKSNGGNIGGATKSYYTTVAADEGAAITCTVSATNIGGTGTATSNTITPIWSPASFGSNLVLWFNPNNINNMLQEQYLTNTPTTPVAVDTDPVGITYDQGVHTFLIGAEADTRRPLLGSDGTRNSYVTFDGTNDYLRVVNVTKYLSPFSQGSQVATIMLWWKSALDGTAQFIYNSNTSTGANAGISLQKNTTNHLVVFHTYAGGASNVCSFTTTGTITTASGWTPIIIQLNGVGAGKGSIQIGNATAETFIINAGSAANATSDLYLGCEVGPTAFANGSLGDLVITNTLVSSGDITKFKAYNPTRSTSTVTPKLQWAFDFNNSSFVWADTTFTTPITNSTAIRGVTSAITTIFGDLNRSAISAGSGTSPIWNQNYINSSSVAIFDSSHPDNLAFIEALTRENGGKWMIVYAFQNTNHTIGSHMLSGGTFATTYYVQGGKNYPGNNINGGKQYSVVHTSNLSAVLLSTANQNDGWNVSILERNGSVMNFWTTDLTTVQTTGLSVSNFLLGAMGAKSTAITPNFNLGGEVSLMLKFTGVHPNLDWIADQIQTYKTRLGI